MADVDYNALVGFFLMLIVFASYFIVFVVHYKSSTPEKARLSVLNARVALHLPIYAFLMFISVLAPDATIALDVPITIYEGYSFYAFFTLIVTNLGGPSGALSCFANSGRDLACCNPCCTKDHEAFYKKTTRALFHFVVTRTGVILLSCICHYIETDIAKTLSQVFRLIGTVMLLYSIMHIALFYENVYEHCTNLFGILKMFLLKFSVGLIVIQGLIKDFMIQADYYPPQIDEDDSDWSKNQQMQRGYCTLVLLEFAILCIPYLFAHARALKNPPSGSNDARGDVQSMGGFLCSVLSFLDVRGYLTLVSSDKVPLTQV